MIKKIFKVVLIICFSLSIARAQTAEVTIQLNEQFFDALLEAIFRDSEPPEFPLSIYNPESQPESTGLGFFSFSGFLAEIRNQQSASQKCSETIKLQRQIDGVNTAVRFREGRIFAPIAFTGNYNPPLIGCIDFAGFAETNIELEFDKTKQTLIGRAKVLNVNLSGAGSIGSGLLARMVQSSIDKKINPIPILQMDRVSFVVPIQNSGSIRMKAVGIRHEVVNGALNVHITYEFQKV